MSIRAISPFPVFLDSDGSPLSSGYVYFGVSGSNPETVPQAVYWDEALSIPAAQPIRTLSGFLLRAGSPASVFLAAAYSMTVRNRNRVLVYSSLVNSGYALSAAMTPVVSAATLALARDAMGVSKKIKGYQAISLTHLSDLLEPSITAGSEFEVDGTFYEFPIDEAAVAGGWGAIAVSTVVYMYLVPAGAAHTWIYSIVAPTWDTAKQGWYNGANRCFGGLYKDAGGDYSAKWFYRTGIGGVQNFKEYGDGHLGPIDCAETIHADGAIDSSTTLHAGTTVEGHAGVIAGHGNATLLKKVINMGDWNMDTTNELSLAHGLGASWKNVRSIKGMLRDDTDSAYYCIPTAVQLVDGHADLFFGRLLGEPAIDATNIHLFRTTGGAFDNAGFDSTPFNRGWITIEYVP